MERTPRLYQADVQEALEKLKGRIYFSDRRGYMARIDEVVRDDDEVAPALSITEVYFKQKFPLFATRLISPRQLNDMTRATLKQAELFNKAERRFYNSGKLAQKAATADELEKDHQYKGSGLAD